MAAFFWGICAMAKVVIVITTAQKLAAAGSTEGGGYRWEITDAVVPDNKMAADTMEPTATFEPVPPGSYVATVRKLNGDGTPVEPQSEFSLSQAFSIAAPPPPPVEIMLDAPVGMTISIVVDSAGSLNVS